MVDLYFAYGSNMSTRRLQERIQDAQPVGRARLDGFRIRFNKRGRDDSGKANLVADARATAWGVLFELRLHRWPTLDEFEPGYSRTTCRVTCDRGRCHDAHVYLADSPFESLPPFDWYRDYVLEGAVEHGLPEDYVAELRGWRVRRGEPGTD